MKTQWANKHNLPPFVTNVLKSDDYGFQPKPNQFSATGLLKPARAYALLDRPDLEIVLDYSDMISIQMGQAIHALVEKNKHPDILIQEQRFEATLNVEGSIITIAGKPDFLYQRRLVDIKTTSVWGYIFGEFDDYVKQLSIYRWILMQNGIEVQPYGIIWYWFTDWKRSDAKYKREYPQTRTLTQDYQLMPLDQAEAFIRENVIRLKNAKNDLPLCTNEELWLSPDKWAVMKKGRKSAVKLHDSEPSALTHIQNLGADHYLEKRPGRVKRCPYCSARSLCSQYTSMQAQGIIDED